MPTDDRFDFWASILFFVGACISILVALSFLVDVQERSAARAFAIGHAVGVAALLLIGIRGLVGHARWARPFAVVLLVLLVIEGALRLGIALIDQRLDIPILGIAALVVLGIRRGPIFITGPLSARDRRTLAVFVVLAIALWTSGSILVPLASQAGDFRDGQRVAATPRG